MVDDKKDEKALVDLAEEYTQATIAALVADDVLKHVPIVRTLAATVQVIASVRDRLFERKLVQFMTALSEVPAAERQQMVSRLEADPAYGRKVGEHVVEILDRVESLRKPAMVALAFAAYAKGEIDGNMLARLNVAIDVAPLTEINRVQEFHAVGKPLLATDFDPVSLQVFANAGLAVAQSAWGGLVYAATDVCDRFVVLILDREARL